MSPADASSPRSFEALVAARREASVPRWLRPSALMAWALVLAVALMSCYVYVLLQQVKRAEVSRQALLPKAGKAAGATYSATAVATKAAGP